MRKKISVIIPLFNAEKTISKCIKSLLEQTFSDFELILVNDGSSDRSLNTCKYFGEMDSRITIINKENEGSIKARSTGIKAAIGEYITFVDADDWVSKDYLQVLNNEVINSEHDIVVGNMYKVISKSSLIKVKNKSWFFNENKTYTDESIKKELVTAYFHGHPFPASLCGKLYKKEIIENAGKYLKNITFFGDDLYYNLEILLNARSVRLIEKAIYYYSSGGNTSRYMPYLFQDMIMGYQINKKVINDYFSFEKEKHLNGISIMLINTFKTYLTNLFISNFSKVKIMNEIASRLEDGRLEEAIRNQGVGKYFPESYINALRNKDIEYLYNLGRDYKKSYILKKLVKFI